ncbi:MAG: bifunctional hydroxymethylpyrimidine kinase/phosphomethylpyrimidine kinase [Corallococcus sp.]|nr:bifunctional hydroxymethylpyrimidine kinase/phosphomethylpyrimidine kinase [Bacillota bacterium]MCM1534113.1 bifunctional hydroxymethylpyrimidine kinase/phosphomethylpyrimidine kinase [Corallococcus sp.]
MKNILIFNDISGLGNCSMSANLPVFTYLGHYCMPVVTACYSCQTGFSNFSSVVNPDTADFVRRIAEHASPDAFYIGFCNNTSILNGVKTVVSDVLPKDCYLFVDPIMGDNGKLYPVFDAEYVDVMKSVAHLADCISPNLTEACLLADVDYGAVVARRNESDYLDFCKITFADFLEKVGVKSAVITGIAQDDKISNLALCGDEAEFVTSERVKVDYSGTGDVFSSVLLGEILNGKSLSEATNLAANFVSRAAKFTERADRRFGVDLSKAFDVLD